jgi:hypothetical protein
MERAVINKVIFIGVLKLVRIAGQETQPSPTGAR